MITPQCFASTFQMMVVQFTQIVKTENYKNNFQCVEFEVPVRQPGGVNQATRNTNL